jgi:tryptophan 2,3-dioxygenase
MSEIEDAESDFHSRMSYGDYLRLSELLGAQSPLTDAHDELLFIIQHQTSELWMKLAIREIRAACTLIRADGVQPPSNYSRASRESSSSSTVHGTSYAP